MSFSSRVRTCAFPLIAVAISATLSVSTALANDPPQVTVNGAGAKMQLNNPVQFQGAAQDTDGIKEIYGTIQNINTGNFITQAGGVSDKASRIEFKFSQSQATRWVSQSFNLPRGSYKFRIRVEDGANAISPMMEVPFVATGAAGANLAAAPKQTQSAPASSAAPQIAIQFPQNGATLQQASAFSGIAKDDVAVVGVIATIMDTATGMFLAPNGQFAPSGELKLRTIEGKNAQWSTPQVQLPPGSYLLSVKAVDNNGQEGQWAQSKFAIAQPAQQAKAAAAATTTAAVAATAATGNAANGMAYCSNSGMDADGDGFGWQNETSCVVQGSKADTHPTCASASSDPDGDGYGWENEKSCIVVVHCQSGASDADGDGFGWENNRSCIVLKKSNNSRFPTCAKGAASDPDGDGYGWENNNTCLVN